MKKIKGMTIAEIAEKSGLNVEDVSVLCELLESKGFIERESPTTYYFNDFMFLKRRGHDTKTTPAH